MSTCEGAADGELGEPGQPPWTISDVAGQAEIQAVEIVDGIEPIGRGDGGPGREQAAADRHDHAVDRETIVQMHEAISDQPDDAAEHAALALIPRA